MASTRPRPGIGSPAKTSYIPWRPSISAPPLATSRNTQPSTVGNRATSGLGGAAGAAAAAAVAGGVIEPVTSLAATGTAATGTTAAGAGARSLSTASLSLASLAEG